MEQSYHFKKVNIYSKFKALTIMNDEAKQTTKKLELS